MKQIIILFSTVLLGIAISGFVMNLEDSAKAITDQVASEVTEMVQSRGE